MQAIKNTIIVKIDKKLQASKREKIGSIYIPDYMMDFRNNLQFGEIVSIGHGAADICPRLQVGGVAIFHHAVEFKVVSTNIEEGATIPEDDHLISINEDGDEFRRVHVTNDLGSELFGTYYDGVISPAKSILFCKPQVKQSEWQQVKGIFINSEDDVAQCKEGIEILDHTISEYTNVLQKMRPSEQNLKFREEIGRELSKAQSHKEVLIKKLKRVTLLELEVMFTPENVKNIQNGDKILVDSKFLYPLNIFGVNFILIRDTRIVHGKTIKSKPVPINDRVIIKQDNPKEQTESGIIIPESARTKPFSGVVISIGEPFEYETDVLEGDRILYHPLGAIEIFIDDVAYVIIHVQNILSKLK